MGNAFPGANYLLPDSVGNLFYASVAFLNEKLPRLTHLWEYSVGNLSDTSVPFLKEKLHSFLLFFPHKAAEAFAAISQLLHENLPWLTHLWKDSVGNLFEASVAFLKEKLHSFLLVFPHKAGEAFAAISQLLHEKLPWLTHQWEDIAGILVVKVVGVLPPGSSTEAIRVWVQLAMAAVLLRGTVFLPCLLSSCCAMAMQLVLALVLCLCLCAQGLWWMVTVCAQGLWRMVRTCVRKPRKMMKAPGRSGWLIPRAAFEADPLGYFKNLRAKTPRWRRIPGVTCFNVFLVLCAVLLCARSK